MRIDAGTAPEVPPRVAVLRHRGFVYLEGPFLGLESAWAAAAEIASAANAEDGLAGELPELQVVGEFTVPVPRAPRRDFQALHIDFGIPLGVVDAVDVARYTALHVMAGRQPSGAVTRIVPLEALWAQRTWPSPERAIERLQGSDAEGILARMIEAADGSSDLPARTTDFLCGMEFSSADQEAAFFTAHGLDLTAAEEGVVIEPGGLLVFDNLRCAHGRTGRRAVGELHQRCLGHRSLSACHQILLRDVSLGGWNRRCPSRPAPGPA